MRLPETKIKETLLHAEKLARQAALNFFAGSFSPDPEVMPLVIQAIETFGRDDAFLYHFQLADLVQTEATVEWAIRELQRAGGNADPFDSYLAALSQVLVHADPHVVAPRVQEIVAAPSFSKHLVPRLHERQEMAAWDAERCWNELEAICAADTEVDEWFDRHFHRAANIVRALAPQGEKYVDRILDLLAQPLSEDAKESLTWLEVLLVMLAGQMRLEQAVPLLVMKLHELGEFLSEECVDALARIGTDAAAAAVASDWTKADFDYRLYATTALERIHSDTTVRVGLELLGQEEDLTIKTKLAAALLSQYTDEAIEPARRMVRQGYDASFLDLQRHLVTISTILGVTFPELSEWKQESESKKASREQHRQEMREPLAPPATTYRDRPPPPKPAPFIHLDQTVGRNDPCPCGSGKKFKKCCLKKNSW